MYSCEYLLFFYERSSWSGGLEVWTIAIGRQLMIGLLGFIILFTSLAQSAGAASLAAGEPQKPSLLAGEPPQLVAMPV
jgi:hypothetical protein